MLDGFVAALLAMTVLGEALARLLEHVLAEPGRGDDPLELGLDQVLPGDVEAARDHWAFRPIRPASPPPPAT